MEDSNQQCRLKNMGIYNDEQVFYLNFDIKFSVLVYAVIVSNYATKIMVRKIDK